MKAMIIILMTMKYTLHKYYIDILYIYVCICMRESMYEYMYECVYLHLNIYFFTYSLFIRIYR